MSQADIGLIGLAVMGQNLALNIADHGFTIAVYNRTSATVDEFLARGAKGKSVIGTHTIKDFVANLKRPRKIIILVKAGDPVDAVIKELKPFLEKGDIIIDGGNSLYTDSNRRVKELTPEGILYVGSGVSGGEVGARHGPSLMPGGNAEAWPYIKKIFQSIAAQVDGAPCCDWVGEEGSGHYVKMVHNGIEYGDMQLICEAHHLLSGVTKLSHEAQSTIFEKWNRSELDSYLIEITGNILKFKDEKGNILVDKILDIAGQKGTGKWTAINALELNSPASLIAESVYVRCLTNFKEERVKASKAFPKEAKQYNGSVEEFVSAVHDALYASKIISYAQGFMMFKQAAKEYKWHINLGGIAMMWRGGCIIRSKFLQNIKVAYDKNPELESLILDEFFSKELRRVEKSWRKVVMAAAEFGIPIPAISSALAFFDGYTCADLPANLLQGMRDYFGGHNFERKDRPRGEFFHVDWAGTGGNVSSNPYSV
jgi:6-phosphogluconate dehydrogenase